MKSLVLALWAISALIVMSEVATAAGPCKGGACPTVDVTVEVATPGPFAKVLASVERAATAPVRIAVAHHRHRHATSACAPVAPAPCAPEACSAVKEHSKFRLLSRSCCK